MQNKFGIAVMCLGLAAAAPAQAELYNLDQAIAYALEHNPGLLAAREQAKAGAARQDVARGARLPQLGLSYSARASNNPLDAFAGKLNTRSVTTPDFDPALLNHPGSTELYTTQLAMRLPVYSGGRLTAESEGAAETAKHAQLQYERAREITAYNALRAYLNVQLTEQGAIIATDAVAAAREHADTTARLAREGRTVLSDKLTAEVNLAAIESQQAQAITRLERARNQLKLAMGLPLTDALVVLPYPGTSTPVRPAAAPLAELESTAVANRKDLSGMRALSQAARARVDGARAAHKPQLDVLATRNRFDNTEAESGSSAIMGVFSLDLYAGGRHTAATSAAAAEAKEAQWHEQGYEQAVRNEVREAYENLREANQRHALARGNVERARENVRQVKQRYGQGRTILIDLLSAERTLVEARNEELVSRLHLETGYAALALAQGTLALPEGERP
jgi:outer membrane protein TolC